MTAPQHAHDSPGRAHSVTFRANSTSNDLRPPRFNGLRAVQRRPAGPALRRGRHVFPIARVRIPFQTSSVVTGLPVPVAVLAALPLGLLPRSPGLFAPIRPFDEGVPESVLSISSPALRLDAWR